MVQRRRHPAPPSLTREPGQTRESNWTNWAGTYSVQPQRRARPGSADEVSEVIRVAAEDELSVKAVGAGHSFTDIAITRGVLVELDRLRGVLSADPSTGLVTIAAGTTLRELSPLLWQAGLALPNLGDIDAQTISGAISTGTHGTGQSFPGLAAQVRALQLVLADGRIVDCSPEHCPDLFDAARVGLGALGIITTVTLQCVPAFALRAVEAPAALEAVLEGLANTVQNTDHFEFYWFPHTKRVLTKANIRLPADTELDPVGRVKGWRDDEFLANSTFEVVNRLTSAAPALTRRANQVAARALTPRQYTDRSYRVFTSNRRVRFREMEYALPRKSLAYVLSEIEAWLARSGERIGFPVEVRFTAADDIPLSTAYGRASCYIAVHQYHRRPFDRYFSAVEKIARSVQGRPHWGKLHYQSADELAPLYPRYADFLAVRDRVDPQRRFGNDYLRRVLGS
ncbi:MAG: FAD-linked oxidoreductase [Frankiales bacterium]|nr:FAD-linked oxidoreductase [Frankiales bacterium]